MSITQFVQSLEAYLSNLQILLSNLVQTKSFYESSYYGEIQIDLIPLDNCINNLQESINSLKSTLDTILSSEKYKEEYGKSYY